jgi:hypothetical protein
LTNGNFVIANWLGGVSAPGNDRPHLVELTPANQMVWTWGTQVEARQIVDVHVLR